MNPESGRKAVVAAARIVAVWVSGGLLYSLVFGSGGRSAFVVADCAVICGVLFVAHRLSRGQRWASQPWVALSAACLLAVLLCQLIIADRNGVWLDEGEYLRTLNHGFIVRDGIIPFSWRWLEPVLAGPLNIFPVNGAEALKACNFASLAVAGVELTAVTYRLGADRRLARLVPVFLLCSYLGTYAATNRLAIDPFNYAAFVLILRALAADMDWLMGVLLLIAGFNSEKVMYWIPVIALSKVLRGQPSRAALKRTFYIACPVLVYFLIVVVATRGAASDTSGTFFQQLHRLAFTWISPKVDDPVAIATTSQMLWFPFGAFTIYALLALRLVERWLAATFLLLVPLVGQVLIAHDSQRMVAYCFIAYIPLGCLYLSSALVELPRKVAFVSIVLFAVLPIAGTFLLPVCRVLSDNGYHFVRPVLHVQRELKLVLEAVELIVVVGFLWLHLGVFASRTNTPKVLG